MSDSEQLIANVEDARENVRRYADEMRGSARLQELMAYARGWYACKDARGAWMLAPSKFVGYADNSADSYVRYHQERDGRVTEQLLREWFVAVTPGNLVFEELKTILSAMFARAGRTPNRLVHLHALKSDLTISAGTETTPRQSSEVLLQRVTNDPDVLGGRPAIRGLRISVRDVLDLLAAGASRDEILADFPYLENDDISASLEYAARAVDHRVVKAA